MAERQKLAFIDDLHVMIAALCREMHPFREVALRQRRLKKQDRLVADFDWPLDGRAAFHIDLRNLTQDVDVLENLSEIEKPIDDRFCPMWRLPLPARTQPAAQGRKHQPVGMEWLRHIWRGNRDRPAFPRVQSAIYF